MAGALATKTILDSTGATVTMRVWDESGVGTGPFSFVSYISPQSVNTNVQSGAPVTIVAQTPTATANGATASRVNAAAPTNATSLKASAGQLYTIDVFNVAAYNVFLKLYNKASAPTVGTDTPVMTIPIQAGAG